MTEADRTSVSYRQGYDQGFTDALCGEEHGSCHPESEGEFDWSDGYYEGQVAGQSARLRDIP